MAAVWIGSLRLAWVWGQALEERVTGTLLIGASPFVGRWDPLVTVRVLVPVAVAVVAVGFGVEVAARVRWSMVLMASAAASVVWVLALAYVDGAGSITGAVTSRYDYLAGVGDVSSPGAYLATFTERLAGYPTHVQGHPPGTVLALWGLGRLGLGGPGPALALMLAIGGCATAAVLAATRALAGEAWARRSALFVALAPSALFATNADFAYAGLAAIGLALVVLAVQAPRPARRGRTTHGPVLDRPTALAVAAGVVFGLGLLCSYGLAVMAVPAAAVCLVQRRFRVALVGGAVALVVVIVPALWGFWWFESLGATRVRYYAGVGSRRPGAWFAFFDLVILSSLLGPVAMLAVARLGSRADRRGDSTRKAPVAAKPQGFQRRRPDLLAQSLRSRSLWPVVGGVSAAVVLALASQMAKGEVERIWLLFVPWLVVATGGLTARPVRDEVGPAAGATASRASRWWLAAHLIAGLGLAVTLRSPW